MLSSIKEAIRGTNFEPGARRAFRALKTWNRASRVGYMNRLYDQQTAEIMSRVLSDSSNCIDVGAHKGSVLEQMLKIAPNGRHFAFEPLPEYAKRLKENFAGVEVHNLALSDRDGESQFYHRVNSPGTSSLHADNDYFDKAPPQVLRVKTAALDHVATDGRKIDLIKIDVEGAQLQVLAGAVETIKRCKPYVIFEHGRNRLKDCEAIYRLLVEECGLSVSLMNDWLEERQPLTFAQFRHQVAGNWYRRRVINWYFLAHP